MNLRNRQIYNSRNNSRNRFQKIIVSTALASSLVAISGTALASESTYELGFYEDGLTELVSVASINYNDWSPNQYWSNDMMWAVNSGLVNGYVNAPHPSDKSKGSGNWLAPTTPLTEAQMLAIIFRYTHEDEINQLQPTNPSYWASTAYQLANKYQVPVKGSATNTKQGNAVVNRGTLAQALATVHHGKPVTMQEAVQFFYDAGLSNGKTGSYTYNDFGVNDNLQRAHIVSFIKRYHDFVTTGETALTKGEGNQVQKPPTQNQGGDQIKPGNGQVVGDIKVMYGNHTYGSQNQAQYDKTMQIIHNAIKEDQEKYTWTVTGKYDKYYEAYLQGERSTGKIDPSRPDDISERDSGLMTAERIIGKYVEAGMSREDILNLIRGQRVVNNILKEVENNHVRYDVFKKNHGALYKLLVDKVDEGYGGKELYSAVFDSLGYNTMIITAGGFYVEVNGEWYTPTLGWEKVDIQKEVQKAKGDIFSKPTHGTTFN